MPGRGEYNEPRLVSVTWRSAGGHGGLGAGAGRVVTGGHRLGQDQVRGLGLHPLHYKVPLLADSTVIVVLFFTKSLKMFI